jgi:hypothetical protein
MKMVRSNYKENNVTKISKGKLPCPLVDKECFVETEGTFLINPDLNLLLAIGTIF